MAQYIKHILTETDIKVLRDYLTIDDDRCDHRPDVRSKHPRWDDDQWPQHIIQAAMDKLTSGKYVVQDVVFFDSKVGLKIHTDHGSPPGVTGKTMLFTLFAEPVAHTVYFKNTWLQNNDPITGVCFTRSPWNPYTYRLENKQGNIVEVNDLRDLLTQCLTEPDKVTEFTVTEKFIKLLESTIYKRSLPYLQKEVQDRETGYQQPAPRHSDYSMLTHFDVNKKFDEKIRQEFISHIPIEDLHGLEIEHIIEWEPGAVIVHNRDQLHCSSSTHARKMFVTVFYHEI